MIPAEFRADRLPRRGTGLGLWLPIFLLWPLLLFMFVVALAVDDPSRTS